MTVVVVHWNQPAACADTLASFRRQDVPLRFVVVDGASAPEHRAALRAAVGGSDDVELVELERNAGFSGGANAGLRRWLDDPCGSDWALLCPHDVEVFDGCVAALLGAAEREPMAGLACADVGDGHIPVIDPYFGGMTVPGSPRTGWQDADFPHGTLMALRRDCLDEIGLFDESFFAYCEEADLALRARRAGWRCGLVRGARVQNVHLGSSVAVVSYLQERNTLRLVREMSGRYHAFIRLCIGLGQVVAGVARPERAPLTFHATARLAGMRDFLLGRTGPPPDWTRAH